MAGSFFFVLFFNVTEVLQARRGAQLNARCSLTKSLGPSFQTKGNCLAVNSHKKKKKNGATGNKSTGLKMR
jgi:hypothetical protein